MFQFLINFWYDEMHRSQSYLTSVIYPRTTNKASIATRIISSSEALTLELLLKEDAADYLYSATVSLGDALGGITRGLFTWATVKLYYSTFYALRARLALKGLCLFYMGNHPFSIRAQAGQIASKEKGQTHKIVLDLFRRHNLDPFLLSQQIDMDDPLQWLMNLREEANYKVARFPEPNVPRHFVKLSQVGVRRACQSYISDNTATYIFDPDHAILAYPLSLIERSYADFHEHGLPPQRKEDMPFFLRILSDEKGTLAHVLKMFSK